MFEAIDMTVGDLLGVCACDVFIRIYDDEGDVQYEDLAGYFDVPEDLQSRWVTSMTFFGNGWLVVETEERD